MHINDLVCMEFGGDVIPIESAYEEINNYSHCCRVGYVNKQFDIIHAHDLMNLSCWNYMPKFKICFGYLACMPLISNSCGSGTQWFAFQWRKWWCNHGLYYGVSELTRRFCYSSNIIRSAKVLYYA